MEHYMELTRTTTISNTEKVYFKDTKIIILVL